MNANENVNFVYVGGIRSGSLVSTTPTFKSSCVACELVEDVSYG